MEVLRVDLEGRCMTFKIQSCIDKILMKPGDMFQYTIDTQREDYIVRINAKNTDTRLHLPINFREEDKKQLSEILSKELKRHVTIQTKTVFIDSI